MSSALVATLMASPVVAWQACVAWGRFGEFLHLETHKGEIPRRDAAEVLPAVTGDTGLVLVLLPGGTFWMGCQSQDSAAARPADHVADDVGQPSVSARPHPPSGS